MTSDALVQKLMELSAVLGRGQTLGLQLARIVQTATRSVPGCDAASIALSFEGRPATAAISSRVALEVDLVQYDNVEGPCLDAMANGRSVRLDLFGADQRFPHFAVGADEHGVTGVLSVAASHQDVVVGTLNMYSRGSRFDETSETLGRILAAQIAIAISRSPEYSAARDAGEHAQQLADDAADVALATGMLVENEDCTVQQAEGLLREAADHDGQSIVEIAQRIIEHARNT